VEKEELLEAGREPGKTDDKKNEGEWGEKRKIELGCDESSCSKKSSLRAPGT
jgi:hypothetical protein